MSLSRTFMYNAYSGAIAAVTAVVAAKLVNTAWQAATGEKPPVANDPTTPAPKAFAWLFATAVGIGSLTLAANRFAASRWVKLTGEVPSTLRNVNLKV